MQPWLLCKEICYITLYILTPKHHWYIKTYYNKFSNLPNQFMYCSWNDLFMSCSPAKREVFFMVNLFYIRNLSEKFLKISNNKLRLKIFGITVSIVCIGIWWIWVISQNIIFSSVQFQGWAPHFSTGSSSFVSIHHQIFISFLYIMFICVNRYVQRLQKSVS